MFDISQLDKATPQEIIGEIADRIENGGWFNLSKGISTPKTINGECQCVLTAAYDISFEYYRSQNQPDRYVGSALDAFVDHAGIESDGVAAWNDSFDSPEPVIKALREFAATTNSR